MSRPLAIETPEEFERLANEFFAQCEAKERRPTVNGLALALGLNSRQSLLNYGEREGFLDAVKRVRTRLEDEWEQGLCGGNAAGTIFWLKNQGWSDKTETELYGKDGGPVHVATFKLAPLE